jgi:hypothetical protein
MNWGFYDEGIGDRTEMDKKLKRRMEMNNKRWTLKRGKMWKNIGHDSEL